MAKQRPRPPSSSALLRDIATTGNRTEQLVRHYHEIGRLLHAGDAVTAETVAAAEVALRPGYSKPNVYKFCQFAASFDTKQLEEFLRVRMKVTGSTLAWTTIVALLSLSKPRDRLKYARLAANETLSATALRRRIQTDLKTGNRRQGSGCRIRVPPTLSDGLADITQIATGLETRIGQLRAKFASELAAQPGIESTINSLERASRKLTDVQETIRAG